MDDILEDILDELAKARSANPDFPGVHGGWAVIFEEVDELWDEVRTKAHSRSKERMRNECVQIAAMAIRFIEDCCDG